jgi:hypothetical protein
LNTIQSQITIWNSGSTFKKIEKIREKITQKKLPGLLAYELALGQSMSLLSNN